MSSNAGKNINALDSDYLFELFKDQVLGETDNLDVIALIEPVINLKVYVYKVFEKPDDDNLLIKKKRDYIQGLSNSYGLGVITNDGLFVPKRKIDINYFDTSFLESRIIELSKKEKKTTFNEREITKLNQLLKEKSDSKLIYDYLAVKAKSISELFNLIKFNLIKISKPVLIYHLNNLLDTGFIKKEGGKYFVDIFKRRSLTSIKKI